MNVRDGRRLVAPFVTITFSLATASSSAVAGEDTDAARAFFNEARRLVAEREYERACPLFERSLKLETGIGTQFNLADCWEHTGRNASAYELYRKVASAAKNNNQTDRERVATERADALQPKLSRLQVRTDPSTTTIRVSRGGVALEDRAWTEPTAVDPGTYRVASTSGTKELWATEITVPQQGFTVVVAVPQPGRKPVITTEKPPIEHALPESVVVPAPRVANRSRVVNTVKVRRTPATSERSTLSVWPVAGLIVGGVGLAFGSLFASTYVSKNSEARDICPSGVDCSESDIQRHSGLVNDANTARLGTFISFGIAAAGLTSVAAYYLWKPANKERAPNASLQLAPTIGSANGGLWGVAAQGSW